jgi:hypothetical protein
VKLICLLNLVYFSLLKGALFGLEWSNITKYLASSSCGKEGWITVIFQSYLNLSFILKKVIKVYVVSNTDLVTEQQQQQQKQHVKKTCLFPEI